MSSTRESPDKPDESDRDLQAQLDRVFAALSDPARRSILERLDGGAQLVSELAAPFEISLQAVSRHIQVLEEAGLIQKERTGRISRCSLVAEPILSAAVWINRYSKYWQAQFDLLAASLDALEASRTKAVREKLPRERSAQKPRRRDERRPSAPARSADKRRRP